MAKDAHRAGTVLCPVTFYVFEAITARCRAFETIGDTEDFVSWPFSRTQIRHSPGARAVRAAAPAHASKWPSQDHSCWSGTRVTVRVRCSPAPGSSGSGSCGRSGTQHAAKKAG